MTKISKNIKRLRTSKGMSQDALAEKLFISRQAVSSWENDRTQPDVDMISKLAEVFGVTVEELLYGEKRNTEIDNESIKTNKILITVFSILGSLLLGVGITILLVALWEKFPIAGKAMVSFLPMVFGQAAAIYTYVKKRDNVIWCESASMLWAIGVSATVGMFSSILDLRIGALNCLLIDAVLIIPVIWFFNAVTPLAFYYCAAISGVFGVYDIVNNGLIASILLIILLLPGIMFTYKNTRKNEENRFYYCIWISVIASIAGAVCCGILLESGLIIILSALFVCLFALNKKDSWSSPFYLFGIAGSAIVSVTSTRLSLFEEYWEEWDKIFTPEHLACLVICALLFAVGFIAGEKNFEGNPTKSAFCVLGVLNTVLGVLISCFGVSMVLSLGFYAVTISQAIVLIVKGAQEKKYFSLNIGLIMLIALMFASMSIFYMDLLVVGFMFVISGAALFVANFYITRKIKREEKLLAEKAVENNE